MKKALGLTCNTKKKTKMFSIHSPRKIPEPRSYLLAWEIKQDAISELGLGGHRKRGMEEEKRRKEWKEGRGEGMGTGRKRRRKEKERESNPSS